jgi:predicted transposase YdaD
MASGYEYQSDFAKKYVAQGEAKGRAEGEAEGRAAGKAEGEANALLHVLAARRLTVSDAQRARILACTDLDTLTRWIERAVTAETTDAVFSE